MRALLLVPLLISCGSSKKPHWYGSIPESIRPKLDTYLAELPSVQDEHGFVDTDQCDSLQHSAVIAATGADVDVMAARDFGTPGRFYRRPVSYPECFKAGLSRSTISRDMLLGVFWWAWTQKNLKVLEEIWDYGQQRRWIMGEDRIGGGHTIMTPTLIGLLAKEIHVLGGRYHNETMLPALLGDCEGYECQLTALQALLRGSLWGGITAANYQSVKKAAERQKTNPLVQFAYHAFKDGDQTETIRLLLELPRYPNDHLPTSAEVCDSWPMQRDDDSSSLLPCPEQNRKHSGGDWLFVAFLLSQRESFTGVRDAWD